MLSLCMYIVQLYIVQLYIVQLYIVQLYIVFVILVKLSLIHCQVRGIGTDIAIVSCMVFLAQFILSLLMGSFVTKVGKFFTAGLYSKCANLTTVGL